MLASLLSHSASDFISSESELFLEDVKWIAAVFDSNAVFEALEGLGKGE